MRGLKQRITALAATVVLAGAAALVIVWAGPALAVCSPNGSHVHSTGGINHGINRLFCEPAFNYSFNGHTKHGHGTKYVAIWHSDVSHVHCDDLETGSVDAYCVTSGVNIDHSTYHDIANAGGCDKFGDGHYICAHFMEV